MRRRHDAGEGLVAATGGQRAQIARKKRHYIRRALRHLDGLHHCHQQQQQQQISQREVDPVILGVR